MPNMPKKKGRSKRGMQMPKIKLTEGQRTGMFVGLGLTTVIVFAFVLPLAGVYNVPWILQTGFQPTGPTGEPVYSISVLDGIMGVELNTNDFSYTLYGTDDLADWIDFEEIESGIDLDDITIGDLTDPDNDFAFFVVSYNGTVAHDDDLYGEDNDLGPRTYYERWAVITPGVPNILLAYQQPSSVGATILDSGTGAALDTSTGITSATNWTLVVMSNATEEDAVWISGPNYENEIDDAPSILLTFENSTALSVLDMGGASKVRVNDTAIRLQFYMISSDPAFYKVEWHPDANENITHAAVEFGDDTLYQIF